MSATPAWMRIISSWALAAAPAVLALVPDLAQADFPRAWAAHPVLADLLRAWAAHPVLAVLPRDRARMPECPVWS